MTEKLCLQWNDFQDNLKSAFGNLRDDPDFADVTLACEDGQQVEAHKIILAASSPFFQGLLGRNKHAHPIIYMRGMKSDDLLAIVDFLYCGEADVLQENLNSFLLIAEELQLKGLMGRTDEILGNTSIEQKYVPSKNMPDLGRGSNGSEKLYDRQTYNNKLSEKSCDRKMAVSRSFSENLEVLEERVLSMMEKSDNIVSNVKRGKRRADRCKVCGKEGESSHIKDHIEVKHLEGIVIPCNLCGKSFRCRKP